MAMKRVNRHPVSSAAHPTASAAHPTASAGHPTAGAWRRDPRLIHARMIAALWVAALLAYSNSFHTGFVNDNSMLILHDSRIQAVTAQNINLIWGQEYWYGNAV